MLLRLPGRISNVRHSVLSCAYFSEKFVRNKRHINIGVIGHQTHGKTTLTSAITKYLSTRNRTQFYDRTDLLKTPEERAKGFTFNNSTIEYETEKCHYCHVDMPGRPDYGKNTIIGASQLDIGILVVDKDGIDTQTREHLIVAKHLGVKRIVIYMNKADLLQDITDLEIIGLDVKDLVKKYGFEGDTPIILGSALSAIEGTKPKIGENSIVELLEKIEGVELPPRDLKSSFMLQINRLTTVAVIVKEIV